MRRRTHTLVAAASIAALLLSGCTPNSPGTTDPTSDPTAAHTDAAPVVSVVNTAVSAETASPGDETSADDGAPAAAGTTAAAEADETAAADQTADADASDAAASDAAAADATDDTTDTGTVHIEAGEPLALAVDGGVFTEVRLVDADHTTVPVDTGAVADGSADTDGAAPGDEATDGAAADDSATSGPAADDSATGASGADAGAADDAADDASNAAAGTRWESRAPLVTGATYTWEATTDSPDGAQHTATGTVTTPDTTAQEELTAKTVISDDATVGIGAPIVVMFNSTIPEDARAAIEARLSVDVTDEDGQPVDVEGSWGWLYDTDGISRVHYRPKEFWPAHVDVEVNLPLEGVEYSPRWYGKEDVELSFEVGRDQRVVADAQTHRMTIERDGKQIADWPTSLGSPQAPSYNGTHVVMAKHEFYTMTSERWNYETDVSWAVRIHNNGEFIHAAPWSVGSQGQANVSHGCVNLSTERAKEYFDMALYGDPVEITGSAVDLTTEHSDISDWVYSWEDWQALSALS